MQVDLLRSLPKSKRNIKLRETAKTEEHIRISCQFGQMYFDGPREYGYGGYRYDGRWKPVASDIVEHFNLTKGDKVLDVGCAKGFLVKDLLSIDIDCYGVDISEYALLNSEPEVGNRLLLANAHSLPFSDNYFDVVLSINTLHNLPRNRCIIALKELERVSKTGCFIQVDSYLNEKQKEVFESWVLTAKYHDYPEGWLELFEEADYKGDYFWTIIE